MKVLFFAPHSAIWIHAFPEALVAEALAQSGHQIVYVGCGGLLHSQCISMTAQGVLFEAAQSTKESVCRRCKQNREIIRSRFEFEGVDMSAVVEADDMRVADSLASTVTTENCKDFVLEGIEVGRIALYELLLQNKKTEIAFKDGEWRRYQASLRNVIVVLRVMRRIIVRERPDRVIVYNALYSVNRVVARLAQELGIGQYFLHAGDNLSNRLQTLILGADHAFAYYRHLQDKWVELQNRPAAAHAMNAATSHFLEVIRGRSVLAYSSAPSHIADLRTRFGVKRGQRVICATMSSEDERFSGEVIGALPERAIIFPKQVDWIKALIGYMETRKDLALIVRVHPREFPNKRESTLSEHAKMLHVALATLPDNVKVNWPTDNISLYDLAGVTDVFTNAWSSAGKEMAWLGLPVVLYSDNLTLYPANLNYVGASSQSEYFQKIEEALRDGWSPERIRRTYRWCSIEYHYGAFDISESFSRDEHRSFLERGVGKVLRSIFTAREQEADCRKRAKRLLASQVIDKVLTERMNTLLDIDELHAAAPLEHETAALKEQVGRLAVGLYGTAQPSQQNVLAGKLREFAAS